MLNSTFITSYERDNETDLDYAKARMFGSGFGRFTSPDPLLSSGRVENPQTWNRYAYVLNNPLNFTDPFGLFEWSEALGGDTTSDEFDQQLDSLRNSRKGKSKKEKKSINKQINKIKKILSRREAFINGIKEARNAAKNLSGDEKSAVNGSLDAYGDEHEANGVTVALGEADQKGAGLAGIEDGQVIVSIRPDAFSSDTLFMVIAHEGSHIIDANMEILFNSPPMAKNFPISGSEIRSSVTGRETEYNAYSVSFWVLKGNNFSKGVGIGGVTYYNKGWSKIDADKLNNALGKIGRGPNDQVGRNPANWDVRGRWN